jgi:hypothetical protein
VSIYAVEEHRLIHTCPADPTPHIVDVRRRILHVTAGRPCTNPATIHIGYNTVTIPCRDRVSVERRCGNCRDIITVTTITITDLGHHGPTHPTRVPA